MSLGCVCVWGGVTQPPPPPLALEIPRCASFSTTRFEGLSNPRDYLGRAGPTEGFGGWVPFLEKKWLSGCSSLGGEGNSESLYSGRPKRA